MSRFREPPDPLFQRLNASISFDRRLWPEDVRGSMAHARALNRAGVLDDGELEQLERALGEIGEELQAGEFRFADSDEDIHMAIERRLIELVGPLGGKLHTGRSRNDQVATDLALFVAERSRRAVGLVAALMQRLGGVAGGPAEGAVAGYTHLQRAQPG